MRVKKLNLDIFTHAPPGKTPPGFFQTPLTQGNYSLLIPTRQCFFPPSRKVREETMEYHKSEGG